MHLFLPSIFLLHTLTHATPLQPPSPNGLLALPSENLTESLSTHNLTTLLNTPSDYYENSTLGINCHGSPFGCIGASSANIMHAIRDIMSLLLLAKYSNMVYYAGQNIACVQHSVFPFIVGGYFCAFAEGNNVPVKGVGGKLLVAKMEQLIEHGCRGCGGVPLEAGNDPNVMGVLTVNFVASSECTGLCVYGGDGVGLVGEVASGNGTAAAAEPQISAVSSGASRTTATRSIISAAYLPANTLLRPARFGQLSGPLSTPDEELLAHE